MTLEINKNPHAFGFYVEQGGILRFAITPTFISINQGALPNITLQLWPLYFYLAFSFRRKRVRCAAGNIANPFPFKGWRRYWGWFGIAFSIEAI